MAEVRYSYVAIDQSGRRVKGTLAARDEPSAFDQLKRDGLSPLGLRAQRQARKEARTQAPGGRETAEFLASLAELLRAGADIRTALSIVGERYERATIQTWAGHLADDIGGGEALDRAFGRAFDATQPFVAPMVAAGEAAGDLPGGLERAAEVIQSRLRLRDQVVTVTAYPAFVLASAVAGLFVILLYIVPSIAPLAAELGSEPPVTLAIMMGASDFLRSNLLLLASGLAGLVAALVAGARTGLLSGPFERLLLDGPMRRTVGGLTFGAFAIALGSMVAAGTPISDALRLSVRTVGLAGARRRLDPVLAAVRQGEYLSTALGEVRNFPRAIVRLAAVGEASNAVGPLLLRSGRMEEAAALRRIETAGRIAGPAMIILLGALLGVLMASLLSGVSQLGQSALE